MELELRRNPAGRLFSRVWRDRYSVLVTRFDSDGWATGEPVGWISGDPRRSLAEFLAEVVPLADAEAAELAAAVVPAWERREP